MRRLVSRVSDGGLGVGDGCRGGVGADLVGDHGLDAALAVDFAAAFDFAVAFAFDFASLGDPHPH